MRNGSCLGGGGGGARTCRIDQRSSAVVMLVVVVMVLSCLRPQVDARMKRHEEEEVEGGKRGNKGQGSREGGVAGGVEH